MEPTASNASCTGGHGTLVPPKSRADVADAASRVQPYAAVSRWLAIGSLLLLYGSIWTIARPYAGLVHDARLYALQAAARLNPDVYLGDLFLRYGSQNDFTLFPQMYAPLIRLIGIEPAAMGLTFLYSVLWLALGYLLAREFLSRQWALLSLGLLIAIPGLYGAHHVFQTGEMFLSARLPAEVLALGALLAYLRQRRFLALALSAAAAAVHPLMALPMIGLLALLEVHSRFGLRISAALVVAAMIGAVALTLILRGALVDPFDTWLSILRTRSAFLFPDLWRFTDWQHQALVLATLAAASRLGAGEPAGRVSAAAAGVAVAGLLLAVVAAAMPEHPRLLMIQPWRWTWVSCFVAVILLPMVVRNLWSVLPNAVGRPAAMLMLCGWLLSDTLGGLVALAGVLLLVLPDRLLVSLQRVTKLGAAAMLAVSILVTAVTAAQFAAFPLDNNQDPGWVLAIVQFFSEAPARMLFVLVCWVVTMHVGLRRNSTATRVGIAISAAVVIALLAPRAVRDWTTTQYSGATHAAFSQWRASIPEDAEVLWPGDAMATWFLLERRSYLSIDQLAGLLYSPRMTSELVRRTSALRSLASPDWWTMADGSDDAQPRDLTPAILADVCAAPGLDFVVSDQDIGAAASRVRQPVHEIDLFLYDCRPAHDSGDAHELAGT